MVAAGCECHPRPFADPRIRCLQLPLGDDEVRLAPDAGTVASTWASAPATGDAGALPRISKPVRRLPAC
jgi:hypothetical protein